MTSIPIIEELEAYCSKVGLKASTVCVRALNDSRFVARHQRRINAIDRDVKKIRRYMEENPPDDTSEVSA